MSLLLLLLALVLPSLRQPPPPPSWFDLGDGTYSRLRGVCGCELPIDTGIPFVRDCAAGSPGAPPVGPVKALDPH